MYVLNGIPFSVVSKRAYVLRRLQERLIPFEEKRKTPLKCVELATGKVKGSKDGFGMGGCLLVDGRVMVLSDAGDLVLVKPTPTEYSEAARSHILSGKCWNAPAVSNGRVYARSTKEGVCLDLSPKLSANANP